VYVVMQLLSVALLLHLAAGQSSSSQCQTVFCSVNSHGSLVQCLEDSRVAKVVIESDHSVGNSFAEYTTTPLLLTRSGGSSTRDSRHFTAEGRELGHAQDHPWTT
jgi:hypothetical protein